MSRPKLGPEAQELLRAKNEGRITPDEYNKLIIALLEKWAAEHYGKKRAS